MIRMISNEAMILERYRTASLWTRWLAKISREEFRSSRPSS
jgi:hypothetical protein